MPRLKFNQIEGFQTFLADREAIFVLNMSKMVWRNSFSEAGINTAENPFFWKIRFGQKLRTSIWEQATRTTTA
jgi:hypothetical protein